MRADWLLIGQIWPLTLLLPRKFPPNDDGPWPHIITPDHCITRGGAQGLQLLILLATLHWEVFFFLVLFIRHYTISSFHAAYPSATMSYGSHKCSTSIGIGQADYQLSSPSPA